MKTRLALLTVLVLFGWAFVRTGSLAGLADRFKRPSVRPSTQQIEVVSETPDTRVVKHPLGETAVPLTPQRIVSLTNSATDSLIALGIRPVLIATSWRRDSVTPYLNEDLQGVPTVRYGETVDLETVLAAQPDLIFASYRDGRLYEQLSRIAPTIYIASNTMGDRERRLLDVGCVLGIDSVAQERLAEYQQYLATAREKVSQVAADKPVSFLRFRRNTCVIYTRTAMFGPLLFEQLALKPDPRMPMVMTGGGWDVLSVERLSQLSSEYIFMVVDRDSEVYLDRVCHTPIWQNLPAVQHGHVFRVASGTWLSGDGVLGCEAIIGDVLAGIAPEWSRDALP